DEEEVVGEDLVLRVPEEDVVEGREDRELQQRGQTTAEVAERIHPTLAVELHRRRLLLLRVVLVLLLQLGQLGGEAALLLDRAFAQRQLELEERRQQHL